MLKGGIVEKIKMYAIAAVIGYFTYSGIKLILIGMGVY